MSRDNALREDFGGLHSHVNRGFAEMRGNFDVAAGVRQRIVELIESLIDQQNR